MLEARITIKQCSSNKLKHRGNGVIKLINNLNKCKKEREKEQRRQIENGNKNGKFKPKYASNHIKCKSNKYPN